MMDVSLIGVSASFAAMGGIALVDPPRITRYFGISVLTSDMRNEIRAVYGGFGVAIAVMLIATSGTELAVGVRYTIAAALLGMAAGRAIGFCIERSGRWPWIFGALEIVGALALTRVS